MNRAFRIVWNESLQAFVVAPEFAKARGKRSSTGQAIAAIVLMLSAGVFAPAWAGALDGGTVISGAPSSIAYGPGATVAAGISKNATAIGSNAVVMCSTTGCGNSVALGAESKADGLDTTAVGAYSYAKGTNATAVGNQVEVLSENAIGIGANQFGSGSDSNGSGIDSASSAAIAIGFGAGTRNSPNGIAIGVGAKSNGGGGVALGAYAVANGQSSLTIGTGSDVAGARSGAIGSPSSVAGSDAYAIGNNNQISQNNTFVVGNAVTTSQGNSVVLGNASTDRAATTASNAAIAGVVFGTFAGPGAAANGVVSVGAVGRERQLINVAGGQISAASTDAVNGSQLYSVANKVTTNLNAMGAGVAASLGGGATYNAATGAWTAPSYTVQGVSQGNVGSALSALDTGLTTTNGNVTTLTTTVSNLTNGTAGLVQQAAAGQKLTVGKMTDGSEVDIAGTGGTRKLTSVTDGTVAANSKDAVNGSQLFATNQQVATNTTNIANNTSNIAGNTTSITNLTNGTVGLVQQAVAGQKLTVGKSTDGTEVDIAGTAGTRKLTNVTDGTIAADSKDAVNGGQLFNTNQQVATLGDQLDTVGVGTAAALGGGAVYDPSTRTWTAPGYSIQGSSYANVGSALGALDSGLTNTNGNVTNLTNTVNNLSNGSVGLVQQTATGQKLTVGKNTDGNEIDIAGAAGSRKLTGVTDGTVAADSKEAVNGGQLFNTNQQVATLGDQLDTVGVGAAAALGGGAVYDPSTRTWTAPAYSIQGGSYTNVGTALGALDTGLTTTNGNVTNLANTVNNLSNGTVGLVQQAAAGQKLTVGKGTDGTEVDFAGAAGTRKLTSITDGSVAANSKDAVNGGQLFTTNQQVATLGGQLDTVGAGTAAALGGGAVYDPSTRTWTAPSYSIQGATYTNVGTALGALDTGLTTTNGNVTNLANTVNNLSNGTVGLVQQAAAGQKLTVGKGTDGTEVDFAGAAGTRKLTSITDGSVAANSKDAVNGGQLHAVGDSVASALGGGSTVNADGAVSAPVYNVTNVDGSTTVVTGVESAISNLDSRVDQNTQAIAGNTTQIMNLTHQVNNGGLGLVKQDAATGDITVASNTDGRTVSVAGIEGDRTVTGVVAGKRDNDAVNVAQLKQAGVVDANGNARSVVSYDDNSQASLTLGGSGSSTPVTLHNVGNGVSDHDAVNVGQMNQRLANNNTQVLNDAYSYTDRRVDDVWQGLSRDIDSVNRQANRGIAAASALIDVTPYVPGHTVVNAGIATYRGEAALGVGMSRWSDNGRVNVNAGVSAARGDSPVVRVGVGYIF